MYQTLLQNPDVEMIRKKNFPCDCGSGEDRGKCCFRVRENLLTDTPSLDEKVSLSFLWKGTALVDPGLACDRVCQ